MKNENPMKRKLSFHPLKFDEAVSDTLKVKPEPKQSDVKQRKTKFIV